MTDDNRAAVDGREGLAGDEPSPGIGHNQPTLFDRVHELVATCNRWTKERPVIESAEIAGILQDYRKQLRECRDELEAAQKAEREPFNVELALIRVKYRDPLELLRIAYERMGELETAWLKREQARLDGEAAERQRLADEAQARAARALDRAASSGTVEDEAEAQRAAEEAAELEAQAGRAPKRAQVRGDLSNKAASLQTRWKAEVLDPVEAAKSYVKDTKVQEAVVEAANRHARRAKREDAALPGVRFYSTQRAQ